MSPFISILLAVRDESQELSECLASIAAQTYPADSFEVLLADGSDVPIATDLLPAGIDARILPNPARWKSPGINMLAAEARGEYLAIVDAHSWLPDDYLERVVATATETGAANVGTRILKVARSPWGKAIAAATSSPLGVGGSAQHHSSQPGPADSAFPGFIRRADFDRLGGLNAWLACNEDDEFNARLRAADCLVWYEPTVEVGYRPRETPMALARQYFRYGRWKIAVARTGIPGYLRLRHLAPSAAVVGGVVVVGGVLVRRWVLFPALAMGIIYTALAVREGRRRASDHGAVVWRTAMVFPVLHVSYGVGFLRGLLDRGLPREGR